MLIAARVRYNFFSYIAFIFGGTSGHLLRSIYHGDPLVVNCQF